VSATACAHDTGRRVRTGDALRPVGTESLPADSLLWSAARRLSWSDFLGTPQVGRDRSAVTGYVLMYTAECESDAFTYRVQTAFLPRQSWVKPEVVMLGPTSRRALQHEQTHFDLAEVDARRIRRALAGLATPCDMTSGERNAVVARFIEEDGEIQARYDRETAHGLDADRQIEWEATASRQLATMARYAR
jgi:hypothetical protein